MTNRERINTMTDEELATLTAESAHGIVLAYCHECCPHYGPRGCRFGECIIDYKSKILKWLKE